MVMLVAENTESKVVRVGDVDEIILSEKTIGSNGPSGLRFFEMGLVEWVVGESGNDVRVEFFLVHDNCCTENRFE